MSSDWWRQVEWHNGKYMARSMHGYHGNKWNSATIKGTPWRQQWSNITPTSKGFSDIIVNTMVSVLWHQYIFLAKKQKASILTLCRPFFLVHLEFLWLLPPPFPKSFFSLVILFFFFLFHQFFLLYLHPRVCYPSILCHLSDHSDNGSRSFQVALQVQNLL